MNNSVTYKNSQQKWYANPDNSFKKNKKRCIKKLKEGGNVSFKSIEKYGITLNEANEYMEEKINAPTYVPAPEPAPADPNTLTYNKIRRYFEEVQDSKIITKESFNNYFGKTPNASGVLRRVLKYINCDVEGNIVPCFEEYKTLIDVIREKYPNENTRKIYIQALLKVLDGYPEIISKYNLQEARDYIYEAFQSQKIKATSSDVSRKLNTQVIPMTTIVSRVEETFNKDSQEVLLINLYKELTLRDDYGDVEIIKNEKENVCNDKNYIIVNANKVQLILQVYKTNKKYGILKHTFSKKVSDMVRASLKKHPRKYLIIKDNVFSRLTPDDSKNVKDMDRSVLQGKLSDFISSMLIRANVKEDTKGAVNILRHASLSELFEKPNLTDAERELKASQMAHSHTASMFYVQKLNINALTEKEIEKLEVK